MTTHSGKALPLIVSNPSWRRHWAPVAGWSVLCALFFATLLLGLEHLPAGDFTGQFHAYSLFQARELAEGRFPVWSPGSNGGFPFAADVQSAAFYPPRLLAVLLSLPWGFSLYVLQVEAIFHIWLAGLFTYYLAFSFTNSRRAALLGAIAFGLGGYLTSYPLLQLAILETISWLPLVLVFLLKASRCPRPVPWLVAAGLTLAMSALAGHPQTLLHVAYVAGLYLLFRGMRARWALGWLLLAAAIVFLVAAGASAAMWLPALQFVAHSTRASVSYEFVATGQAILNYLQLFMPRLFTVWSPEYVGLATIILGAYAWFGRRMVDEQVSEQGGERLPARDSRAEITFWTLLAVVSAWLALGEEGIAFRLFYRLAPGFSLFRQQERLLGVVSLSWALLAAHGFALWLRMRRGRRGRLLNKTAMVALLGLMLCGVFVFASPLADAATDGVVWLGQLVIAALALFLLQWERRRKLASIALILLVAADLTVATDVSSGRQPRAAGDYWQHPSWLALLQGDQRQGLAGRVDTRNLFQANVGEVYSLEDIRGISPLRLAVADSIMALPEQRRRQLLDVEHVISADPLPEPALLLAAINQPLQPRRSVNAGLYRVPEGQGRAWLSYQPLQVAGPREALEHLAHADFDAARQVVLHTPVEGLDGVEAPDGALAAAHQPPAVRRLQPNALEIDVQTEAPALLVVSEWHYPGWKARIDGRSATLYPANYGLQALVIPAGRHTVELRFSPSIVLVGAFISMLSVLTALFVARVWQPPLSPRRESWRRALTLPLPPLPALLNAALARLQALVKANTRLLVWSALLLAATLRFFQLGVQELRGDEAFSYLIASRPLSAVVPALIMAADPHPPLHYLLLAGWLRLVGDSEFAMRTLSALLGVLLAPLLYQLGKRIWSKSGGLLFALLVIISQSQVWLSQDVRSQYVLALLFTTLATVLLIRVVRQSDARLWVFYALVAALAMYSHFYSAFALLAHGAFLLSGFRRRLAAWALSGLAAFLLFSPWLLASVGGWSGQLFDPGPTALAPFLMAVVGELLAGPALSTAIGPWPILGAALLCILGWYSLWQRQRPWALLLGSWLGLAVLGMFLIQMQRATFNPFYIAVAAPAWWALFVAGVFSVARSRTATGVNSWRKAMAIVIILAVVALNVLALARYWSDPYEHGRSSGYRQVAAHLKANLQEGDLLLANFPDPALVYYLRNIPVPYEMQPARQAEPVSHTEQELRLLADAYRRLWFVPVGQSSWDTQDVVFRWLDYHLLLEQRRTFETLTVEAYRPLHSVDELLLPLKDDLNAQLRLQGAYLTVDGLPASIGAAPLMVPAGAELNVSLLWQALNAISDSYTVFVHLLDPAGQLVAQHDGIPAHGTRPTETWQIGETILDEHVLVAPQATERSEALLVVGLYDSASGQRQQFLDGAEYVILANMQLKPPGPASARDAP